MRVQSSVTFMGLNLSWIPKPIGARTTHARLATAAELAEFPVFAETAAVIGDVQVRNRGTLGGSLVHADPAADWPAVFLALDGEATAVGPRGERTIRAPDFFTGILQSALAADEVLAEVRLVTERVRSAAAYAKMRQLASGFAVVGVAAQLTLDRRGRCERASIGVTGINPVPFRATSLEQRLAGESLEDGVSRALCARIEEADLNRMPLGFRRSANGIRRIGPVDAKRVRNSSATCSESHGEGWELADGDVGSQGPGDGVGLVQAAALEGLADAHHGRLRRGHCNSIGCSCVE